jgi:hypothetical protein
MKVTDKLRLLLTCPECGGECHFTRRFVFCVQGVECVPRQLSEGDLELLLAHYPKRATTSKVNPIEGMNT